MAKNKAVNTEEVTPDGSRAINKFRVSDALIFCALPVYCRLFIWLRNPFPATMRYWQNRYI